MDMTSLPISIRVSVVFLGLVLFPAIIALGQSNNSAAQTPGATAAKATPQPNDIPLCNGALSVSSVQHAPSQSTPHRHSVTLSWKAAPPMSNSPQDAIKGYYVYRSLTSHTYAEGNRISESPVRGTECVDTTVDPKKTYFYIVKAVTEGGKQSNSSIEIKALIPFP